MQLENGLDTKIIAGCTDYFPARITRDRTLALLDLSCVAEFRRIKQTFGSWRVAALATGFLTPSVPVTLQNSAMQSRT
jgi:hypothetical protein